MLKERLFGLTNSEGNHGEDVKEYYFYLDSTPTHSYAKMLYKYPQAAFPYEQLVAENARRSRDGLRVRADGHGRVRRGPLLGRASSSSPRPTPRTPSSASPRPTAGPRRRSLHLVPQLWFRNTWCARRRRAPARARGRTSRQVRRRSPPATSVLGTALPLLRGRRRAAVHRQRDQPLPSLGPAERQRVPEGRHQRPHRERAAGRGEPRSRKGTKSAFHSRATVAPGQSATLRLRLTARAPDALPDPFARLRPDVRRPQARGRRVLRRPDPGVAVRGRRQRRPPGLRRPAVDEAGLRLRRRALAERARRRARRHRRRPQPALVPPLQHRRHLDAGQVGVPLVRRVGSGVPRRGARVRRSRLRARAAVADAAGPLPAPERRSSPPTSGTSTTSTRRCTRGRRCSTIA